MKGMSPQALNSTVMVANTMILNAFDMIPPEQFLMK